MPCKNRHEKNVPKHKKCSGTFSFIVREILFYLATSQRGPFFLRKKGPPPSPVPPSSPPKTAHTGLCAAVRRLAGRGCPPNFPLLICRLAVYLHAHKPWLPSQFPSANLLHALQWRENKPWLPSQFPSANLLGAGVHVAHQPWLPSQFPSANLACWSIPAALPAVVALPISLC